MNNRKKSIFISDLDGTLLDKNGHLSSYCILQLKNFIESGGYFTVASMRRHISITRLFADVGLNIPVIELNGGFITNINTGEKIVINSLNKQHAILVGNYLISEGIAPLVIAYDGVIDCCFFNKIHNAGLKNYYNLCDEAISTDPTLKKYLNKIDNYSILNFQEVSSFIVIDKQSRICRISNDVEKNYPEIYNLTIIEDQYLPGWSWLYIQDKKASKKNAIVQLISLLGFSEENTYVFGDDLSDLSMVSYFPNSITVDTANVLLREKAKWILNRADGKEIVDFVNLHSTIC